MALALSRVMGQSLLISELRRLIGRPVRSRPQSASASKVVCAQEQAILGACLLYNGRAFSPAQLLSSLLISSSYHHPHPSPTSSSSSLPRHHLASVGEERAGLALVWSSGCSVPIHWASTHQLLLAESFSAPSAFILKKPECTRNPVRAQAKAQAYEKPFVMVPSGTVLYANYRFTHAATPSDASHKSSAS